MPTPWDQPEWTDEAVERLQAMFDLEADPEAEMALPGLADLRGFMTQYIFGARDRWWAENADWVRGCLLASLDYTANLELPPRLLEPAPTAAFGLLLAWVGRWTATPTESPSPEAWPSSSGWATADDPAVWAAGLDPVLVPGAEPQGYPHVYSLAEPQPGDEDRPAAAAAGVETESARELMRLMKEIGEAVSGARKGIGDSSAMAGYAERGDLPR